MVESKYQILLNVPVWPWIVGKEQTFVANI